MATLPGSLAAAGPYSSASAEVESRIHYWGERIFDLMDAAPPPSVFSKRGLYGALMDWAMRDDQFKTRLFRFVDVLPTLKTSAEVTRHLHEYLDPEAGHLPPSVRLALKASTGASWLFAPGVKAQITGLARQFMLGNEEREIAAILRRLLAQQIAFTVDVLGETVVSEPEADQYAARYLALMDLLGRKLAGFPVPKDQPSPLNFSVKISALYSQIHPADPDTAIAGISARLRPLLRRAGELGAFINFDMEHFGLKRLTLQLFKTIFAEPEFARSPACGLALQAYLQDSEADTHEILAWARAQGRRITIRLVKGAYWDYETIIARQRHWPIPVFTRKADTDARFEQLTALLLEQHDTAEVVFGTHSVRSIAHALAQAERVGIDPSQVEFQMLFGMADAIKSALLQLHCRVREYCPVGELLPGMAYLVRRLLENTSNEGFLAHRYVKGEDRTELLRKPTAPSETTHAPVLPQGRTPARPQPEFTNEPATDFTIPAERQRFQEAIARVRQHLGGRYPLVINNRPVQTRDWLPSLNPANQKEIIGYAAQAGTAEAGQALEAARAAQPHWARTPAEDRAALLERLAALLRRDRPALCALEMLEAGKAWPEADADVAEAIDFCAFYAAVMRDMAPPQNTQHTPGESNVQYWLPRGLGVVIAPWNFPLAILTGMTAAALVTGNAALIKPSDQTPVLGARLMALLVEAGLPPGVANLVTGPGREVGAWLIAHPQVDFIAFTGSKEVGLSLWETAGRTTPGQANLKKVVCEMGGKNAIIVDGDADLDEAVLGCIISAFGYQGQKCSALSRLIVLADNYDKFLERLVAAAASLRVGPAEIPGNVLGPVINREAQQRVLHFIEIGKAEATLAWQGSVPPDPEACYVPPAIFSGVKPHTRLWREEIFGPVLSIAKARDFEEALALANDSEFALTGGCYSRSPVNLERAKSAMVCGNLYLNRPITGALVERQPFGGFKMSGAGTKAGGREYLQQFLVPRVITENCLRRGFAPLDEEAPEAG